MKCIILAGGIGSRLWPMSRRKKPKQFFDLVTEKPLIRDTYDRLRKEFSEEDIYISTSALFMDLILEAIPEVTDRIIVEPGKRDTGPAMGYVAAMLEKDFPDEPIAFIPSDHYIKDEKRFLENLRLGEDLIKETGKLLDIAVEPTFPSTLLGYTKIGEKIEVRNGIEVYQFAGHKEKPDYETAKSYIESGDYLWHANYYMWTPAKFMQAFCEYAPEIGQRLREIQEVDDLSRQEEIFQSIPKLSIDYAVTEKMNPEDVLIIKGDFGWSDIGAWNTLQEHLSDGNNVEKGRVITVKTKDSLIYGDRDKITAVIGLENIIVVDTKDALLVSHKDHSQSVKDIVAALENDGKTELL